jgi:hypothetical protein
MKKHKYASGVEYTDEQLARELISAATQVEIAMSGGLAWIVKRAGERMLELLTSPVETSEQRSASWLIEIHGEHAPQWLERIGTSTWGTYDAGKAIRFSRKEDAESLIPAVKMLGPAHWRLTATEHMWIDMRPEEPKALRLPVCHACDRPHAEHTRLEQCPGKPGSFYSAKMVVRPGEPEAKQ